jgi:hypothetical protein
MLNNGQYEIKCVERAKIKSLIESKHYSGSINGVQSTYHFAMYKDGELIGAMLYGNLGMANAWKKYGDKPEDVIELRRLVLIDDTPKNSESFFIGWTLRWLTKNTNIKTIVSYADPNYGHSGTIYRATNFTHVGMTSRGKVIMFNGKKYHDKTIRTKYNGHLKPYAQRVKDALESGEAFYVTQEPKHIYVKTLKRAKNP